MSTRNLAEMNLHDWATANTLYPDCAPRRHYCNAVDALDVLPVSDHAEREKLHDAIDVAGHYFVLYFKRDTVECARVGGAA